MRPWSEAGWRAIPDGTVTPDGTVIYGDRTCRVELHLVAQAREMQASGLVEFASTANLHRGVLANPQGNMVPAAITW